MMQGRPGAPASSLPAVSLSNPPVVRLPNPSLGPNPPFVQPPLSSAPLGSSRMTLLRVLRGFVGKNICAPRARPPQRTAFAPTLPGRTIATLPGRARRTVSPATPGIFSPARWWRLLDSPCNTSGRSGFPGCRPPWSAERSMHPPTPLPIGESNRAKVHQVWPGGKMWFFPVMSQPQKTTLYKSRIAAEALICILCLMSGCKMWFYSVAE